MRDRGFKAIKLEMQEKGNVMVCRAGILRDATGYWRRLVPNARKRNSGRCNQLKIGFWPNPLPSRQCKPVILCNLDSEVGPLWESLIKSIQNNGK